MDFTTKLLNNEILLVGLDDERSKPFFDEFNLQNGIIHLWSHYSRKKYKGGTNNMYCPNCRQMIDDNTQFCPSCGCDLNPNGYHHAPQHHQLAVDDNPEFFLKGASCCIPLLGFILYFLWKDSKPNSSRASLKWALVGFITPIVFYVLYFIFVFILAIFFS